MLVNERFYVEIRGLAKYFDANPEAFGEDYGMKRSVESTAIGFRESPPCPFHAHSPKAQTRHWSATRCGLNLRKFTLELRKHLVGVTEPISRALRRSLPCI